MRVYSFGCNLPLLGATKPHIQDLYFIYFLSAGSGHKSTVPLSDEEYRLEIRVSLSLPSKVKGQ